MKISLHPVFLLISFLITSINLFGQECGFQYNQKDIEHILELNAKPRKIIRSATDQIPVSIHIVRQTDRQGGISTTEIDQAFEIVNDQFEVIDMEFNICGEINYIDNDRFYQLYPPYYYQLYSHNVENTINIYFTDRVLSADSSSLCGFAYFPSAGLDVVVMKNSCVNNGSTLVHELGHYFNLLHTHDSANGKEPVNGSNCSSTGDLICDTPADPKLSSKVDSDCQYFGRDRDSNGDLYQPDTENIMSYSQKKCRKYFSVGQLERIRKSYDYDRNYLSCGSAVNNPDNCNKPLPVDLIVTEKTYSSINVKYTKSVDKYSWAIRKSGNTNWTFFRDTEWSTITFSKLQSNSTYEIALQIKCNNDVWSEWSRIIYVTTPGQQCIAPSVHDIILVERSQTKLKFKYSKSASRYTWAFRKVGSSDWDIYENTNWTTFWYSGLRANTTYEVALKIKCQNSTWSEWSGIKRVTTQPTTHCHSPALSDIMLVERTSSKIMVQYKYHASRYTWAFRKPGHSWEIFENKDWRIFWYTGLHANTTYEFSLKIKCSNGTWSEWSNVFKITTSGYYHDENHDSNIEIKQYIQETDEVFIEEKSLECIIYPNPATEYIQVKGDFDQITGTVMDVQGKVLRTFNQIQPNQRIDLQDLAPGAYLLNLVSQNGDNQTKKLLVE